MFGLGSVVFRVNKHILLLAFIFIIILAYIFLLSANSFVIENKEGKYLLDYLSQLDFQDKDEINNFITTLDNSFGVFDFEDKQDIEFLYLDGKNKKIKALTGNDPSGKKVYAFYESEADKQDISKDLYDILYFIENEDYQIIGITFSFQVENDNSLTVKLISVPSQNILKEGNKFI